MKKTLTTLCVLCLVIGAFAGYAYSGRTDEEPVEGVPMVVSPQTISFKSLGGCVSVHAEIPYSIVDCSTIEMNGLTPYLCKPDLRGELVAKFNLEAVKAIVSPPSATMVMTGATKDGVPFSGTDTVRVVD